MVMLNRRKRQIGTVKNITPAGPTVITMPMRIALKLNKPEPMGQSDGGGLHGNFTFIDRRYATNKLGIPPRRKKD